MKKIYTFPGGKLIFIIFVFSFLIMLFFGITILFMWLANFLGASIRVRLGCRVVCLACVAVTIFQLIINFSFAEFLKNIKSIDFALSEFLVNVLQFFH